MSQEAKEYARHLVSRVKPLWSDLTSSKVDPRREILRSMTVDETGSALQVGIAGAYLEACVRAGDRSAWELMVELGMEPDFDCGKRRGRPRETGMRTFVVYVLAVELMAKIEGLKLGANDGTATGTSAVDMIRAALEEAGLACIDRQKGESEAAGARSMEKAIRRMWDDPKFRELFDPVFTEAYEAGSLDD